MKTLTMTLTASALALAGAAAFAQTQQAPGETIMQSHRPGAMMQQQPGSAGSGVMGPGMMGPGMMGSGMMGPGMARMMMIMMDTNGDGELSMEEVQAVHERMFTDADADKSGALTPDELGGFMQGPSAAPSE